MKLFSIELDNWMVNYTGEPVRYRAHDWCDIDPHIILYKTYIGNKKYIWQPMFNYNLHFLNYSFKESYGSYIEGSDKFAQKVIDDFLTRFKDLTVFI